MSGRPRPRLVADLNAAAVPRVFTVGDVRRPLVKLRQQLSPDAWSTLLERVDARVDDGVLPALYAQRNDPVERVSAWIADRLTLIAAQLAEERGVASPSRERVAAPARDAITALANVADALARLPLVTGPLGPWWCRGPEPTRGRVLVDAIGQAHGSIAPRPIADDRSRLRCPPDDFLRVVTLLEHTVAEALVFEEAIPDAVVVELQALRGDLSSTTIEATAQERSARERDARARGDAATLLAALYREATGDFRTETARQVCTDGPVDVEERTERSGTLPVVLRVALDALGLPAGERTLSGVMGAARDANTQRLMMDCATDARLDMEGEDRERVLARARQLFDERQSGVASRRLDVDAQLDEAVDAVLRADPEAWALVAGRRRGGPPKGWEKG